MPAAKVPTEPVSTPSMRAKFAGRPKWLAPSPEVRGDPGFGHTTSFRCANGRREALSLPRGNKPKAFRDAAARALGHEIIRAEDFGARPDSLQAACLAGVRDAEAVVLLMGARYGAPQSSGLSATHGEYREARERCPVLVMVHEAVERETEQTALGTKAAYSRMV